MNKQHTSKPHTPRQPGFTLVEMAMVLTIVGLLLGALIPTLSAQIELQRVTETRKQLNEIQQALIGYAIINGRLPCPASATATEDPVGGGVCNHAYDGFIPAATLGLSTTDSSGFAVDSWGNRIRYAVTPWPSTNPTNTFTTASGLASTGISNLAQAGTPYLQVCSAASTNTSSCTANTALTAKPGVPVVIYSTGKNGVGSGLDERENTDNDQVFTSHTPTPSTATNGEFDDLVIWLSANNLVSRMIAAGKLP